MGTHIRSKGNARDRRKRERAEKFGPPGATHQRQDEVEAAFGRMWDSERHSKADVRELERTDYEPKEEGLIQKPRIEERSGPGKHIS
jgi:hypothetical protein